MTEITISGAMHDAFRGAQRQGWAKWAPMLYRRTWTPGPWVAVDPRWRPSMNEEAEYEALYGNLLTVAELVAKLDAEPDPEEKS